MAPKSIGVSSLCRRQGIKILSADEYKSLKKNNKMKFLGQGGQGQCWRLRGMGKDWVVKESKDDLEHEIRHLDKVKGLPGVQKIVAFCPDKNVLITKYAGRCILEFLMKNPKCAISLLRQLTGIILCMTSNGVYHNDIKRDNVCVRQDGTDLRVTLIDFGLAST